MSKPECHGENTHGCGRAALVLSLCALGLFPARADYATSGTLDYTSQTVDLAALLGETPEGPFVWNHTGSVNLYAGGLITSLADVAALAPARLELKDATVDISGNLNVASAGIVNDVETGGSGELVLDNVSMKVHGHLNVSCGNALGNKATSLILGSLTLKNGTTVKVGNQLQLSATISKSGTWNPLATNVLTLSSGSILTVTKEVARWDSPSGKVVFDGGKLAKPYGSATAFFNAGGYGYNDNGDNPRSSFVITSTAGSDIVLETHQVNALFQGQYDGYLMTEGAIRKTGRGRLQFNGPSGNNGYVERLSFNGMKIDEGELTLFNSFTFRDTVRFPNARRGLVDIAAGARLDLNNNDSVIESLAGSGTIYASNGAALTISNETAVASRVKVGAGITTFAKKGSADAQLALLGANCGATHVEGGTLALVDPQYDVPAFTRYRFRVTKVNSDLQTQIMEFREIKLFEGDADITYAASFNYDETTVQTGGTGIFGHNEEPWKIWDMDLTSKWCDLRYADQNCWWVEFIYQTPVQVTSYNWAKTNNADRSPSGWVLEGSDDGVNWTVVDEREMDTRSLPVNAWVVVEPFAVSATSGRRVESLGALTVAGGATLDLSGLSADVAVTSLTGGGEVVFDGELRVDVPEGETNTVLAAMLADLDALVKTGAGTLKIAGEPSFAVDVRGGSVAFVAADFSGKFYRFTLRGLRGGPTETVGELGKLHLFAANGAAVNTGLTWYGYPDSMSSDKKTNTRDGTPAKDLPAGTFSQAGNYVYSIWEGDYQDPSRIFRDASDNNKWCTTEHAFDENEDSTWYTLNFRLADDAAPVVSYNLRTANSTATTRQFASWKLEGSVNGEDWILLDERSLGSGTPGTGSTWYNGGTPYDLSWPESAALAPAVAALRVDLSAADETIAFLRPAENGTLQLTNPAPGADMKIIPIPLAVGEFSNGASAKLASWSVSVDGEPLENARVRIVDGSLVVRNGIGLTILVR